MDLLVEMLARDSGGRSLGSGGGWRDRSIRWVGLQFGARDRLTVNLALAVK
jgi:hypothetical protein